MPNTKPPPEASALQPGVLRVLAGGMKVGDVEAEVDILDPAAREPYVAAGLLRPGSRYSNRDLHELTPDGRDMLDRYRAAIGTTVDGVAHGPAEVPLAGVHVADCNPCTLAARCVVPSPCPTEVAYWPQFPVPGERHKIVELVDLYGRYSAADDGLYNRLVNAFGADVGGVLYSQACDDIEHGGALVEARARLTERLLDARHALDEALVAKQELVRLADAEYDGTSLGAELQRYLPVLIDLTARLHDAATEANR